MVPYMHIQGGQALQMNKGFHPFTLGNLRDGVIEGKHRAMKNMGINEREGKRCIGMDYEYKKNIL